MNKVQTFSQSHFPKNLIGRVKLPFIMPDRIARSAPARSMLLIPVPIPLPTQGLCRPCLSLPAFPVELATIPGIPLLFFYILLYYSWLYNNTSAQLDPNGIYCFVILKEKEGEE
jgi:hypothetical protein